MPTIMAALAALAFLLAIGLTGQASAAPQLLWKKQLGTLGEDSVQYVKTDANGNVMIVYKYYKGTSGAGITAYALIKYDNNGTERWRRELDGQNLGLALDPAGRVYVLVDRSNLGTPNLVKYAADGTPIWSKVTNIRSMYSSWFEVFGLAVDGSSRPVVKVTNCIYGVCSIYAIGYTTTGAGRWTKTLLANDNAGTVARRIEADTDGSFILSGESFRKVWVGRYSAAGTLLWMKYFDTIRPEFLKTYYANVKGLAIDQLYNILISGNAFSDPSGGTPRCGSTQCGWVSKLSPAGTLTWTRVFQFKPPLWNYTMSDAQGVTTDAVGNVFVGGWREVLRNSQLYQRPWITALSASGALTWQWYWPLDAARLSTTRGSGGIAVDPLGNVVFGGATNAALAGPFQGIPYGSSTDGFVAKLKP